MRHKAQILENLTERVSNLSYIQENINMKLKFLCQSNSNSFDTGMKKVRAIMTEMQDIRVSLKNNKLELSQYKKDIAANIARVNLLKIKKKRIL